MPAVSEKERRLMAIAEHHPEMVHEENKGVLQMSHKQLHDYATTSEKGLPIKKKRAGQIAAIKKHMMKGKMMNKPRMDMQNA